MAFVREFDQNNIQFMKYIYSENSRYEIMSLFEDDIDSLLYCIPLTLNV